MRSRVRRLVLLAACVAGLTGAAQPALAQDEPPEQVPWAGVMVDGPLIIPGNTDFDDQWERIADAHVSDARVAFYWPDVEPKKGKFIFDRTDELVRKAVTANLQVLPVILRTPRWAGKSRKDGSPPKSGKLIQPLLKQMIGRYGPEGSFWTDNPDLPKLAIRDWQIYNEPELPVYWNDKNWAKSYVALLKAAHQTIKREDPGARTILAGLTNRSWLDLEKIYKAGGKNAFDVAALHVYTKDAEGVATVTGYARDVMKRYGDKRKKIWLTELTWPSSQGKRPGARPWETSANGQAQRVAKGIPYLARQRKRLGIDKVVWYAWVTVEDKTTWQSYAGLLRLRKGKVVEVPAYDKFVAALRNLL